MFDQTTRRRPLVPALVTFALLLGACSGGGSDDGSEVATLLPDVGDGGAADAAVRGVEVDPDLEPDEAALLFSQCMRDEGLDFPDLSVDAEGNIELRDAFQSVEPGTDGFQEAMDACDEILQQTGFGGGRREVRQSTEFQDALIGFSECLRDDGFDVGDLTLAGPGGGGPGAGAGGAAGDGQDGDEEAGQAGQAGQGQRGQRGDGFGNRGARFAENLGLDYEDPEVATAVDGCLEIVDSALADLGAEPQGQGRG
ncbi:MAG: hypothetical protein AAGA93_12465 [Actinomycetota bacterium]